MERGIIVPNQKTGSVKIITNHRFISVKCVTCKIFERIIANKIHHHLIVNNLLQPSQHGFIRGRSTCTNLLELLRHQVAIEYINFSKPLSLSATRNSLLGYLYGIRGVLLSWLQQLFTERTHFLPALVAQWPNTLSRSAASLAG